MDVSRRLRFLAAFCFLVGLSVEGRKGLGPGEQEYGHITVRPGAHTFYWLYYTTATPQWAKRPLVIWLQGGPGGSSTSIGNFEEIGPLGVDLAPRNSSWVDHVNVLFIDNPVGTGFSYVEQLNLLTSNNEEIANDLVEFMRSFLLKYPAFQTVPLYIFSQSYGGKMSAQFALKLEQAKNYNKLKVNLQAVALGDAWISPIDSVLTWAPYLHHTGLIDANGFAEIDDIAQKTKKAVDDGRFFDATNLWYQTERLIAKLAGDVDFYNIMTPIKEDPSERRVSPDTPILPASALYPDWLLPALMNGPVKLALEIPKNITHGQQAPYVFTYLHKDFMKPVTSIVEELLNKTSVKVVVYNGQLDLIVDTLGTVKWVDELRWQHGDFWRKNADRKLFIVDGVIEGFVKSTNNLTLYWINRAGHMVPADNPAAGIEMLRLVTNFDKSL